jgi:protein SDA1
LAQACHALVDPDTLRPALMAVVDRFVSDRSRPEVMAVGLNAVREICARTPLVMDATLLSDLLMYVKHRDKPVATAARSLLNLYRVLDPSLLHKSQRGREAAMAGAAPLRYGESTTADGVENINLLARYREHGEQFPYVAGDGNDVDDEDQSVDASELSHDEGAGDDDDGISFEDENEDDVEVEGDEGEEQEEEEEEEEDDDDEEQQEEQEDDDDDDDEDEVDVDDEDDDAVDNVDDNADDVMTSKKRTSSAARLDAVRILSDSDFADLERAVEVARDAGSNAVKRKRMVEVEDEIGPLNAPIDKSVLEKGLKVAMTKEERQAKFGVSLICVFCFHSYRSYLTPRVV